jgi:hypothetical protein
VNTYIHVMLINCHVARFLNLVLPVLLLKSDIADYMVLGISCASGFILSRWKVAVWQDLSFSWWCLPRLQEQRELGTLCIWATLRCQPHTSFKHMRWEVRWILRFLNITTEIIELVSYPIFRPLFYNWAAENYFHFNSNDLILNWQKPFQRSCSVLSS